MVAPRVVASTIQPMAVLPRKGMNTDTVTTVTTATPGTPRRLSPASLRGASPSRPAANSSRERASMLPMRLVSITPNSDSISTVTPACPR